MSTELTAPAKIEADPIGTALKAAGVTSAAIEKLAEDYGELAQTKTIDTPEQYEVIKRAQLAHRDIRTSVTAALKEEREEAVRYQKFIIQEEKRILAVIATTEEPLKRLREEYDKREELKAQEEARQWQEKMNLRKQAAFDIGYTFNGSVYTLDRENGESPWVLREDQVAGMAMNDDALYTLLEAQAAELKMTREIKAEAEAKAEEERLAKEAAHKAEADRIAAAQAELERKEKEMMEKERQMALRILKARTSEVVAAGGSDRTDGTMGFGSAVITQPQAVAMSDDDFAHFIISVMEQRTIWDRQVEEERLKQEQERIAREEQLKKEAAEEAVRQERLRAEAEQRRQEEEKAREAYKEAQRIASMGDKGKMEELSATLASIYLPDLQSAMGQHGIARVRKHLIELINMVNSIAKDL